MSVKHARAARARAAVKKKPIDVQCAIQLHLVTDGATSRGWLHTHGMDRFDLPDLEIRDLPLFLGPAAASLLNGVCNYLLNSGKVAKVGETMELGPMCYVEFQLAEPPLGTSPEEIETHYQGVRWRLVDPAAMTGMCGLHGKSDAS